MDVDSLVDDDSAENPTLDDDSTENSPVEVDDVSEYLIPVNDHQNGVCDMDYMIKVTTKDIIHSKCERVAELVKELKNQLVYERKYDESVKQIGILIGDFCTGNPAVYDELQQALQSVEYNSPAKKVTLAEIRMLISNIDDQMYRIRQIFFCCTNSTLENLPTTLATLLNDRLIDYTIYTKLASMTSITYPELRTLLVKSELVKSEPGVGMDELMDEEFEKLLQSPDIQLLWDSLRNLITQHSIGEEGQPPFSLIQRLLVELKNRGILNENEFDAIKNDTSHQNIGNVHRNMIEGKGIWSTIGHRIVDLVKRKFLNVSHGAVD